MDFIQLDLFQPDSGVLLWGKQFPRNLGWDLGSKINVAIGDRKFRREQFRREQFRRKQFRRRQFRRTTVSPQDSFAADSFAASQFRRRQFRREPVSPRAVLLGPPP